MKKRVSILASLASLMALGVADVARASTITYVAQPQGGSITYGAVDTFNIYVQEQYPSGGSSSIASDGNLYSAGVGIVEQSGGTGVSVATTTGAIAPNSAAEPAGFSGNTTSGQLKNSGGTGFGAYFADITANSATVGVAPSSSSTSNGTVTNLYLLGAVTMNVASDANAVFLVESLHDTPTGLGAPAAGTDGNTLTFNSLYDMDTGGATNAGVVGADGHPSNLIIQAPEPTGVLFMGLAASGLAFRRRRVNAL